MSDKFRNHRGIAILFTIMIITLLIAATLELSRKARSSLFSAAATRDRFTISHMASSGINAAMAILVKDKMKSDTDSMQEDWADSEKISEVLKDITFTNGNVTVIISDELARIQVNALVKFPEGRLFNEPQQFLWDRFLRLVMRLDETYKDIDPTEIINSTKDWLDSGDDDAITGLSGAESDYYEDLDPPYPCRNVPFTRLGELALVKGVTSDLLNGLGEIPGISSYMTISGITDAESNSFTYEGKININTAELPVLSALLPSENEDLALAIYDYRLETSNSQYIHDLSNASWYKNVPGCSDIEIDSDLITTDSDVFRIESNAVLREMKITSTAIVKREKIKKTGKWKCRVLSLKTE